MPGLSAPHRVGIASFAALSLIALTGCLPLKADRPQSTPAPSSSAPTSPRSDAEAPVIPDVDLSLEAGADLPDGLDVSLGSGFSGDRAWEAMPDLSIQTYMHIETKCTVKFAATTYEADTDDDRQATLDFFRDEVGVEEDPDNEISLAYPFDTSGVPGMADPEREIEFIGYAFGPSGEYTGDILTTARAITATNRIIVIEFECPDPDVLNTIIADAQQQFTIGLYPADLFGA